MDWGFSNPHRYLASSWPTRDRLSWSACIVIPVVLVLEWLFGFSWVRSALSVSFALFLFWLLAYVVDLAAWRPGAGALVAALCGTGCGALWWTTAGVDTSIWAPIAGGMAFALLSLYVYAGSLRRLGPPPRIHPDALVSLEGPVELADGKLTLRIPLAAGGDKLAHCAHGIGVVVGDYLTVNIPIPLATKLGITVGSTVVVDNHYGKFNIRRGDSSDSEGQTTTH